MNHCIIEPFQDGSFRFFRCHCFQKDRKALLLGEEGCTMLLDEVLLQDLRSHSPSPSLRFKLVQHGLAHVPGKIMVRCKKEIQPTYFIIDLTKRCNFDCIYCFRDLEATDTVSWEVLRDIVDYILAYCKQQDLRQIGLQMWGGEPVLAMDRIEYVVDRFHKSPVKASIDIETNGSMGTPDAAQKLYAWGIHVGVSLDGGPTLHDQQRKLRSGEGSSALVESGIRNLQGYYGDSLGGITVVTRYNHQQVQEMLDHYIYGLGLKSMKFNIVRDNDNAGEAGLGLSEEQIVSFANELLDLLQAYRMMGARFSESNIAMRAANILHRSGQNCCISHGCQGGKKIISFDQKGDIFPCEMTDISEVRLGSIYDGGSLTDQLEAAIQKSCFFAPKKDDRCVDCPWWYYCQGGCTSRNYYAGKYGKIDMVECALDRTIYPRIVEWILDGYLR